MVVPTAELKPSVVSSPVRGFWKVFGRNRMAFVGLVMILLMILVAIFAPVIAPYDPKSSEGVGAGDVYQPPSPEHPLGTDDAGRNVLSEFVYGARISLVVGFFASFISLVIGGSIGLSAGFYGGRTENTLIEQRE